MISKTLALSALVAVQAGDTNFWKSKSVYQVLTDRFGKPSGGGCSNLGNYCGGNYAGMQAHLDYITGMGFDAIWISPIVDNTPGGYHGYWARDWTKTNSNFGSDQDLKNLVNAAHSKGLAVMVDVVANHVGPVGSDFHTIVPFNSQDHYHPTCQITNWNDQNQVENCRLADLPDLNQSNSYVADYLKNWVKGIVQNFGFDGIRIDTIPEVPKSFWSQYGPASGVFQMGEAFNGDPSYVGGYQGPLTGVFNYPMYYTIKDVFGGKQSMYNIRSRWSQEAPNFKDINALGIFVDNHDNARFLNQYHDVTAFKSALVFSLTAPGIPFYYYGSEQEFAGGNDPQNREIMWNSFNTGSDIYKMTAAVNKARKAHSIWSHNLEERYVLDNVYAFSRGDFFVGLTNGGSVNVQPNAPWANGTVVCNIFYPTQDCQTIQNGKLNLVLNNGEAKIFIPKNSAYFEDPVSFTQ